METGRAPHPRDGWIPDFDHIRVVVRDVGIGLLAGAAVGLVAWWACWRRLRASRSSRDLRR